jgi:hypothetical protein
MSGSIMEDDDIDVRRRGCRIRLVIPARYSMLGLIEMARSAPG